MASVECSECGQQLSCQKSEECWCNSYPKLLTPDKAKTCLCADCLEKALATTIQNKGPLSEEQMMEVAAMGEPKQLTEGLHYNMEEVNGTKLLVMSKWYLLRRGYCCENGCRNCPYGFRKNRIEIL